MLVKLALSIMLALVPVACHHHPGCHRHISHHHVCVIPGGPNIPA